MTSENNFSAQADHDRIIQCRIHTWGFYPLNVRLQYKPGYDLCERQKFDHGFAIFNRISLIFRLLLVLVAVCRDSDTSQIFITFALSC